MKIIKALGGLLVLTLLGCENIAGVNNYAGNEIKVTNHCYFSIEILVEKNTYGDSVISMGSYDDTLVFVKNFQDSLRVRKPFGKEVWVSLEGVTGYRGLTIGAEHFE